ncbi:MAG: diacylglycerol kinase family lipid kinase [Acidobacteria bacterium]|nr:diacylglycerol kinase family lipid kinase [Acidobacteriota bacterium]
MTTVARTLVIVNPVSGPRRGRDVAAAAQLCRAVLAAAGTQVDVAITTGRGDAHRLARAARDEGATTVVAWGGDGTINEVASALVESPVALGIVPGGSGNGLARELGIPRDPREALSVVARAGQRHIDAGRLDAHWFFNVAGVGLDARVAHHIARPGAMRGLWGYLQLALIEAPRYQRLSYTVRANGHTTAHRALFIALANSRQYGNDAIIAPRARLDDGLIDVVVVEEHRLTRLIRGAPSVFRGDLEPGPLVHMLQAPEVEVKSEQPMEVHIDGEPLASRTSLRVGMRPRALVVRVP